MGLWRRRAKLFPADAEALDTARRADVTRGYERAIIFARRR